MNSPDNLRERPLPRGQVEVELEAVQLRDCWAVRPKGQLGTCGFYPVPWEVVYVRARSAKEAVDKAVRLRELRSRLVVRPKSPLNF